MAKEANLIEKIFATIFYSVFGTVVGVILGILSGPVRLLPISHLLIDTGPWAISCALAFGVLAFKYPQKAMVLICFIPGCDIVS